MGILTELQKWLEESERFFPTPAESKAPAGDPDLPLLRLLNEDAATPKFPLTIPAVTGLFESTGIDELKQLFSATSAPGHPTTFNPFDALSPIDFLKNFFSKLHVQADVDKVKSLLTTQLAIGASLISIVNPENLPEIFIGQSQYFFGHTVDASGKPVDDPANVVKTVPGYLTVADEIISPPALPTLATGVIPATPAAAFKEFGSLFSKKTGEQYVRDLTRVGLEAVGNKAWNLLTRYPQILTSAALPTIDPLKINDASKAQAWFKGFADFSEANVTAVVEQALSQGGGPIQANPLLAASIATAAGTSARKATQHIFLREIGIT